MQFAFVHVCLYLCVCVCNENRSKPVFSPPLFSPVIIFSFFIPLFQLFLWYDNNERLYQNLDHKIRKLGELNFLQLRSFVCFRTWWDNKKVLELENRSNEHEMNTLWTCLNTTQLVTTMPTTAGCDSCTVRKASGQWDTVSTQRALGKCEQATLRTNSK